MSAFSPTSFDDRPSLVSRRWMAFWIVVCRPAFSAFSALLLCIAGGLGLLLPMLAPVLAIIGVLYVTAYAAALLSEAAGRFGRRNARRLFYVGRSRHGFEPVWLVDQHLDARKIEVAIGHPRGRQQLAGMSAFNALGQGGGLLYVTESGDASAYQQIFDMALAMGREDDVLLVNLVSAPDPGNPVTHTFNPFASASADALSQMIMSGVDQAMDTVSRSRASLLLNGMARALTWERDQGLKLINAATIKLTMQLPRLVEYTATDRTPPMPTHVRAAILDYLNCLPGFMLEKGSRQAHSTLDHHNYVLTQLLPMLSVLSNVYGHVFVTPDVDVDMRDVVLNRRILVVMLPPLEKAVGSRAVLAKALEGSLRAVANDMVSGLAAGYWATPLDHRSVAPFTVVFEHGSSCLAAACSDLVQRAALLNMQFIYGFASSKVSSELSGSDDLAGFRMRTDGRGVSQIDGSGFSVGSVSLSHLGRHLSKTTKAYLPVFRQA
jgi:hypothetical protein